MYITICCNCQRIILDIKCAFVKKNLFFNTTLRLLRHKVLYMNCWVGISWCGLYAMRSMEVLSTSSSIYINTANGNMIWASHFIWQARCSGPKRLASPNHYRSKAQKNLSCVNDTFRWKWHRKWTCQAWSSSIVRGGQTANRWKEILPCLFLMWSTAEHSLVFGGNGACHLVRCHRNRKWTNMGPYDIQKQNLRQI